jgi:hypothetical protein
VAIGAADAARAGPGVFGADHGRGEVAGGVMAEDADLLEGAAGTGAAAGGCSSRAISST